MIAADTTERDVRYTTEVVAQVADIDEVDARRHVVLASRMGPVAAALARGDHDMLATALRMLDASCLEWLSAIERDRAA